MGSRLKKRYDGFLHSEESDVNDRIVDQLHVIKLQLSKFIPQKMTNGLKT
jgi:hypothetical protein